MTLPKLSLIVLATAAAFTNVFGQSKPIAKKTNSVQKVIATKNAKPFNQTINNKVLAHPAWCLNNTIYEVNLRQFGANASFKNFINELPRLKKLGVNILWFMPIYPIGKVARKGKLGSYYAVQDYNSVSSEYGTTDDFGIMVNAIHNAGMKIIIDWVANYTSPDNIWTKEHPDFYTKDKNGKFLPPLPDRTDVVNLNYDNEQLRKTMIESMRFWLTKFDIDGFRCDKAEMIPTDFWIKCRNELDKTKHVFMLAEGEKPELHKAFDMTYTWSFYNTMKSIIKGEKKRSDLLAYFEKQKIEYNKNDLRMYFTSNHDENTPNSTEFEAFGDAHKAIAALTATLPGMPLVYSGQESGQTKHLNFFDKDVIDWGNYQNADFYSILNWAHNSTKSLLPTANMEIIDAKNEHVFVYIRKAGNDETIVIVNLTKENQSFITPLNIKGNFRNIIDENIIELIPKSELTLEPYQFFVLQKK